MLAILLIGAASAEATPHINMNKFEQSIITNLYNDVLREEFSHTIEAQVTRKLEKEGWYKYHNMMEKKIRDE